MQIEDRKGEGDHQKSPREKITFDTEKCVEAHHRFATEHINMPRKGETLHQLL